MNTRTRRAALYAIGVIAFLASANALGHSYAGLYDWANHHDLSGWQAMSWPAEIDVFLAIGELALYIAYLDGWPARQRIWPWATALAGLSVSIAGNIGHIQPGPGQPVLLADRLTAATSPIAAFAGLAIGLLVLKVTRQQATVNDQDRSLSSTGPSRQLPVSSSRSRLTATQSAPEPDQAHDELAPAGEAAASQTIRPRPAPTTGPTRQRTRARADSGKYPRAQPAGRGSTGPGDGLLRDATAICQAATASGERLSQRTLARQLRGLGHRFSNQHLHGIAANIGLDQNGPRVEDDPPAETTPRQQLILVAGD